MIHQKYCQGKVKAHPKVYKYHTDCNSLSQIPTDSMVLVLTGH